MSEKTVHSKQTSHGYSTPHRFPSSSISEFDILKILSTQLYPTGRAWYGPNGGVFDLFHDAINVSLTRLLLNEKKFLDGLFPDNENFTIEDVRLWEYRLGLISNNSVNIDLRKQAIKRKLGFPNNIKARQHNLFIESQLQLAGFNVWVHENTIPYKTPDEILSVSLLEIQHGGITQHGNSTYHGGDSFDVIANSIEEIESFGVGGANNLWSTFFIGGEVLGEIANVPLSRLKEFKELVIKLKPAHTVAFTFINYN
jgi:hypothetical protein